MKKIVSIVAQLIDDPESIQDNYGLYTDEQPDDGSYSYEYVDGKFFVSHNAEDEQQAKEDYMRQQKFEDEELFMFGVRAMATIYVGGPNDWQIVRIYSQGHYGIESDTEGGYYAAVGREQIVQLKELLRDFGFSDVELNSPDVAVTEMPDLRHPLSLSTEEKYVMIDTRPRQKPPSMSSV